MKSPLRFSKASGSTKRRIEHVIRKGWHTGYRISDYYKRRSRRNRTEAGSHAT